MEDFIQILRDCLDQCDRMIKVVSDPAGREIIEDHRRLLITDIRRIEEAGKKNSKFTETGKP